MFTENPFAQLWKEIIEVKAQQTEALQLLRSLATIQPNAASHETPVNTAEAARQFGISKQTLYQNVKKIKHTKRFGRLYWYPSDIKEYINSGEVASNLTSSQNKLKKPRRRNPSSETAQDSLLSD